MTQATPPPTTPLAPWEFYQLAALEHLLFMHDPELSKVLDFDHMRTHPEEWRALREDLHRMMYERDASGAVRKTGA